MADAIYVPANGQQFEGYWRTKPDYLYKDRYDLRHFTEKSFFKYDYSLTNAYYNVERSNNNIRDVFRYPTETKILVDSGGFQIATFNMKGKPISIQPLDILRWIENNATIGMNLDVPLFGNFESSIKQSLENFNLFQEYRTNYNFKLYNVLHGRNLSEIESWYKQVKNFNFDGWAIGIKPSDNVFLQVVGYLVLHQNGAKDLLNNCHFFGMSSIQNMITLAMLSDHFGTDITFDSSSFNMGSRMRAYYLPGSVRNFAMFGRDNPKKLERLPCNCPVCRNVTVSEMYAQDVWYTPVMLSLHNLYQFVEVNKSINCMVKDPEVFLEFANSVGEKKLVTFINQVLQDFDSHNYQHVYNGFKYDNGFTMEKPTVGSNSNMVSFR